MAVCDYAHLEPYIKWIAQQPGGLREQVVGITVVEWADHILPGDIFEGSLPTYLPFLPLPPGLPGHDIRGVLSGSATKIDPPYEDLGVTLWSGHDPGDIQVRLASPRFTVKIQGLECETTAEGNLRMSGTADNGGSFSFVIDKVTTFRRLVIGTRLP